MPQTTRSQHRRPTLTRRSRISRKIRRPIAAPHRRRRQPVWAPTAAAIPSRRRNRACDRACHLEARPTRFRPSWVGRSEAGPSDPTSASAARRYPCPDHGSEAAPTSAFPSVRHACRPDPEGLPDHFRGAFRCPSFEWYHSDLLIRLDSGTESCIPTRSDVHSGIVVEASPGLRNLNRLRAQAFLRCLEAAPLLSEARCLIWIALTPHKGPPAWPSS
jgi:hypothetical protein